MEAVTGDRRFREEAEKLLDKQQGEEKIMMCEYINLLEARGEKRGEKKGEKKGEAKLTSLLAKLYELGRDDEAKLAVQDMEVRARLYQEFSIANYIHDK